MTATEPLTPRVRTIAGLARLAGVSAGTVSRALAGSALVNTETRERIQALAAAHKFRPNQMASRLRTQRTGVIGVVVPLGHERRQHLSDPFFMMILGLADALTEQGYDLMLSRIIPDADDWLEQIVGSGMLDGVLLIGQSDQFETIESVARNYRPMVVWGAHQAGQAHCAVGVDKSSPIAARAARVQTLVMTDIDFPSLSRLCTAAVDVLKGAALHRPADLRRRARAPTRPTPPPRTAGTRTA